MEKKKNEWWMVIFLVQQAKSAMVAYFSSETVCTQLIKSRLLFPITVIL